ncbi:hypothetical protein [Lelliottia amnigena]|uniref:hypothetical protein n=1 Tax=Lelliottia amnigena TaxID=61646 RepID=UPI0040576DA9
MRARPVSNASRYTYSLSPEKAEKLLSESPQTVRVGNYQVHWEKTEGKLIDNYAPAPAPVLKPNLNPAPKKVEIPDINALTDKLKKDKNNDINNPEVPSPKTSEPR